MACRAADQTPKAPSVVEKDPETQRYTVDCQIVSLEKVQALANSWIPEVESLYIWNAKKYEDTRGILKDTINLKHERAFCIVAHAPDLHKDLGFAVLDKREANSFYNKDHLYLDFLCVHPSHQGHGIGGAIAKKIRQIAIQESLRSIRVFPYPKAVPFYERNGYCKTSISHYMERKVALPDVCEIKRVTSVDIVKLAAKWFAEARSIAHRTPEDHPLMEKIKDSENLLKIIQCIELFYDFCFTYNVDGKPQALIIAELEEDDSEEKHVSIQFLAAHPKRTVAKIGPPAGSLLVKHIERVGVNLGAIQSSLHTTLTGSAFYRKMNYTGMSFGSSFCHYFHKQLDDIEPLPTVPILKLAQAYPTKTPFIFLEEYLPTAIGNLEEVIPLDDPALMFLTEKSEEEDLCIQLAGYLGNNGKYKAVTMIDVSNPNHFKIMEFADGTKNRKATREIFHFLRKYARECGRLLTGKSPPVRKPHTKRKGT